MRTESNEPIHPVKDWANYPSFGLTKREYIATSVLQGLITGVRASGDGINIRELCESSILIADKFITELNKTT